MYITHIYIFILSCMYTSTDICLVNIYIERYVYLLYKRVHTLLYKHMCKCIYISYM